MASTNLLMDGVELMLLGVGSVFVFLALLIGCITLLSRFVMHFLPADAALAAAPVRRTPTTAPVVDSETLAVISAAVREHRIRRSR
ncbi:MAG: OadG family protein [Pseudomonas sp.]